MPLAVELLLSMCKALGLTPQHLKKIVKIRKELGAMPVAHAYNPSYL
jgi:hypothetical protein